ncbi:hypothetical protein CDD83_10066 [Cordyceps sp. RAO-2017]|nr:hypothetical protein CDD83_10066 [Cordyceps sp. RAO-2017]
MLVHREAPSTTARARLTPGRRFGLSTFSIGHGTDTGPRADPRPTAPPAVPQPYSSFLGSNPQFARLQGSPSLHIDSDAPPQPPSPTAGRAFGPKLGWLVSLGKGEPEIASCSIARVMKTRETAPDPGGQRAGQRTGSERMAHLPRSSSYAPQALHAPGMPSSVRRLTHTRLRVARIMSYEATSRACYEPRDSLSAVWGHRLARLLLHWV